MHDFLAGRLAVRATMCARAGAPLSHRLAVHRNRTQRKVELMHTRPTVKLAAFIEWPFRTRLAVVTVLASFCFGCASPPPYAGEWVLEGQDDGDGHFTPAPADKLWAIRFDPPATVSSAQLDSAGQNLAEGTMSTSAFIVFDEKQNIVQFGMFAAHVADGSMRLGYPGKGTLRLRRWEGPRLFPPVTPIDLEKWKAEQQAAPTDSPKSD